MLSQGSNSMMQQSHSMPSGVDSTGVTGSTPERKKAAKNVVSVKVKLLDESVSVFQIQHKALGKVLFDQVCKMLNLLESDYFGLEYEDHTKTSYWLDTEKQMNRQIGLSLIDPILHFCVKFFTPDPAQLEEPYTRYLFAVQIKQDLAQGILQCNDNTAALMASYIIQAECGDYMEEDYPDHSYLSSYKFVPHQDADMERRIMEHYKKNKGQTPEIADLNLLETARRCELFGIRMSKAKDHEGVPLKVAVAHMGILVFQNFTKINTFSWAKIRKLSFKKKRFLIKLHPEGYGYYKDTVDFYFDGRNECKNFWKKCIEHHGFFRCTVVKPVPRQKAKIFSRGSSFRYSGKTQKEIVDYVRSNFIKRQPFQRSSSCRITRTTGRETAKHANMGRSVSTHLPVSESEHNFAQPSNTVSTPVSQSCGSVTLTDKSGDELSPSKDLPMDMSQQPSNNTEKAAYVDAGPPPGSDPTNVPSHQEEQNDFPSLKQETVPEYTRLMTIEEVTRDIAPPSVLEDMPDDANIVLPQLHDNEVDCQSLSMSPSSPNPPSEVSSPINETAEFPKLDTLDIQKKRVINDHAYFIVKEILMTERTYKKDLEILSVWLRDEVSMNDDMPEDLLSYLFSHLDPICASHSTFLKLVEQRLTVWEGKLNAHLRLDCQKIGDIMMDALDMLQLYHNYATCHIEVLDRLHSTMIRNKKFELVFKNFELQKLCYLPLTLFILKPIHRLFHYQVLLQKLLQYYLTDNKDYNDVNEALQRIQECTDSLQQYIYKSENKAKLFELQRDLIEFDDLIQPGREFIREGSLQKYSKKGFQQRMFFLFSDVLVYANKLSSASLQFKVHGKIPVSGMVVEDSDDKLCASNCFTIYSSNQAFLLSASNDFEKEKWMTDLSTVIKAADNPSVEKTTNAKNNFNSFNSDEVMNFDGLTIENSKVDCKQNSQRSNMTVQVCWHRNTSVGIDDFVISRQNQLSGYLLRKFKNSNGWQKLWVVFTNFCLFFFKSYQNDFPLASLPLLGYSVNMAGPSDGIKKDYVFKLQFKYHIYFFRAESEYTFRRWIEVINNVVSQTNRSSTYICSEECSYMSD